jgi:hypothetical protein
MSTIRYGLVWGRAVSIVTVSFFVLTAFVVAGIWLLRFRAGSDAAGQRGLKGAGAPLLAVCLLAAGGVSIGCFLYAPRAYVIHSGGITVDRIVNPVLLSWDRVTNVREVTPEELSGTVRVFGNGGLFGRVGTYRSGRLGTFRMYLTNEADAVLVEAGGRFVLSPHPPGPFVADAVRALDLYRGKGRPHPGRPDP